MSKWKNLWVKKDHRISCSYEYYDDKELAQERAEEIRKERDQAMDEGKSYGPTHNPLKYGAVRKTKNGLWAVCTI